MPTLIRLYDETTTGDAIACGELQLSSDRITARDLIRQRVQQEVTAYNEDLPEYFRGLVQPTASEQLLNGYKMRQRQKINWLEQYQKAIQAFESNGFMILVDDRQVEDLDQELELTEQGRVSFLRLIPLVGG